MAEENKETLKEDEVVTSKDQAAEESVSPEAQQDSVEDEVSELETAKKAADDWQDKFLRASAEMQNIQRRSNEERLTLVKYRSQDLAKKILPSLDNLERALAVDGLTEDVKKGLTMVQDSLVNALKEEGIVEIPTDGAFNPQFHQAVQTVPADDEHEAETIVQVFQKGYQLHERVLRPSMVVVAQ